jgi:hypothetical protein
MRKVAFAAMMLAGLSLGCILPIYSSSQNVRARQLIFQSEDLRQVPEIWERVWNLEFPDPSTPYRVHGGVI